jgi:hypothetical protein
LSKCNPHFKRPGLIHSPSSSIFLNKHSTAIYFNRHSSFPGDFSSKLHGAKSPNIPTYVARNDPNQNQKNKKLTLSLSLSKSLHSRKNLHRAILHLQQTGDYHWQAPIIFDGSFDF